MPVILGQAAQGRSGDQPDKSAPFRQSVGKSRRSAAAIAGHTNTKPKIDSSKVDSCFNPPMRNPLQFIATLFTCLLMACGTAHGQQADAPVRAAVEQFLIEQTRGLPGRVELEISPIDSRNRLPACTRLIPAMPPGGRAWGRSSVTVRCDAPAPWTIYVEVQVRVFGEYLILARPVRAGQVIGPDDLARKSGDLTAEGEDLLGDMTAAIGHRTRVALAAGKPLRASMLLLPPAVRRGDTVRVITRGAGFSVANEGKALNDAAAGQNVRVRLGSGRVLSGQAREDGQVEVGP